MNSTALALILGSRPTTGKAGFFGKSTIALFFMGLAALEVRDAFAPPLDATLDATILIALLVGAVLLGTVMFYVRFIRPGGKAGWLSRSQS
jgi:hypothetical protein